MTTRSNLYQFQRQWTWSVTQRTTKTTDMTCFVDTTNDNSNYCPFLLINNVTIYLHHSAFCSIVVFAMICIFSGYFAHNSTAKKNIWHVVMQASSVRWRSHFFFSCKLEAFRWKGTFLLSSLTKSVFPFEWYFLRNNLYWLTKKCQHREDTTKINFIFRYNDDSRVNHEGMWGNKNLRL